MTIVDYAIGGNNAMLRRLVNESNVNTVGLYNKGVLHWAVIRGNIEIMNLWLSFPNCNVNIQSKLGNTPLHECVTVREWRTYEMDIDVYMENEGYEYEDTETFFFSELVKNVNEEAILHDIFKYL